MIYFKYLYIEVIVQRLIIDLNTIHVATKVNDCFFVIEETDNDVWVL